MGLPGDRPGGVAERGPFDIIGDIHGCIDELIALLRKLGHGVRKKTGADGRAAYAVSPASGRTAIFLGDLVDRGPDTPGVLRLVMQMVEAGTALCVPGNHDDKLMRKIRGANIPIAHGLGESLAQLDGESAELRDRIASFIDGLTSHHILDGGKLVVAHAGLTEELQGRASRKARNFAMYGETTGETDEFGLPVRYDWAAEYRGMAAVVYGHVATHEPEWLNHTLCIDTGCVFGGSLTALRWPERELVSVKAAREYSRSLRPFLVA